MKRNRKLIISHDTLRILATKMLAIARGGAPNSQEVTCSLCREGCVPPVAP